MFQTIVRPEGLNLSLIATSSLVAWFICLITVISSIKRPVTVLLFVLFPISAITVILVMLEPAPSKQNNNYSFGLIIHIVSSILAYSVLAMAALQAIVLAVQESRLRDKRLTGLLQVLPPIQLLEAMLFELIWIGISLLTVAIAAGAIYVEDLFAQHLVHKTILTILAWFVFAILLITLDAFWLRKFGLSLCRHKSRAGIYSLVSLALNARF